MIRGIFVAGVLVAAFSSSVLAQSDPIAERQQIMKKNGQELRPLLAMQKGSAPFNLAEVQANLKAFSADAKKAATLFPENSKTGNDTRALPKIWTEKANFDATFAKFVATSDAALAAIKDEASFKTEFPKVASACDSCHDTYRAPRK